MKSALKDLGSFLFLWLTTVYFELLILLFGGIGVTPGTVLYIFLFSVPFVLLSFLASTISKSERANYIIKLVFIISSGIFFGVEFFSRAFFHNYMSISSIMAGGKGLITDFMDETLKFVGARFYILLIMILPIPVFMFLSKKKLLSNKAVKAPARLLSAGITLFLFSLGIIIVWSNENDKQKYSDHYEFDTAAQSFGISAAIRLDAEYLLFDRGGVSDFSFEDTADDFTIIPLDTSADPENADSGSLQSAAQQTAETIVQNDKDGSEGKASDSADIENDTDKEPEPEPVIYYPHDCGLDFAALAESETNSKIAGIHKYIASLTPTYENKYTGLFKGKNLIFFTAEAFSKELISEELTPALYRLSTKGINIDNYYQPIWGGSTSTGEFSNMTGLVPAYGIGSMKHSIDKNMYYTIGNQLRRENYFSRAFHAHSYDYYGRDQTHENLGYDKYMGRGNGLEDMIKGQWPESDLEMIEATMDMYMDNQPFSVYYMTVSGHTNYNWGGNSMSKKNKEAVADLDLPEHIKAYLACNLEFEYALEALLDKLEEKGILNDTVIVIGADHYPFGLEQDPSDNFKNALGDLYGYDYTNVFERDHNRLIIWSGCLEENDPIVVEEPVYSLDIIPTLSNLFGTDYDSRFFVGRDILSDDMPLVLWGNYSWMTDKGYFNAASGKFTPFDENAEIPDDYVKTIKTMVSNRFAFSKNVLDYDYFNVLFGDNS